MPLKVEEKIVIPATKYSDLEAVSLRSSFVIEVVNTEEAIFGVLVEKVKKYHSPVASGEIIGWIWQYSYEYNIDFVWFYELLKCESGFDEDIVGDHGLAFGVAQYHYQTFQTFCDGSYKDTESQIRCSAKMISQGLQNHWTCVKLIGNYKLLN